SKVFALLPPVATWPIQIPVLQHSCSAIIPAHRHNPLNSLEGGFTESAQMPVAQECTSPGIAYTATANLY
ncbi:hypothetical protein, partial [Thiolapillus sp.]